MSKDESNNFEIVESKYGWIFADKRICLIYSVSLVWTIIFPNPNWMKLISSGLLVLISINLIYLILKNQISIHKEIVKTRDEIYWFREGSSVNKIMEDLSHVKDELRWYQDNSAVGKIIQRIDFLEKLVIANNRTSLK